VLADLAKTRGIGAVALRYFNAAGAVGDLGEDHHPESHLIPRLLGSLLDPGLEFQIFGTDYDTPDGTCIRDYIHVADLAEAHITALALADKPGFTAINLGSARGYSVHEIIAAVARVSGRELAPPVTARRPGDPGRLVAANEQAKRLLGWEPSRDLHTIVSDAWDWHQRHPRGYPTQSD
jgi:UDP-glucose 4-epimerase